MHSSAFRQVQDSRYLQEAADCGVLLPLEQTPTWDSFDDAVAGRSPLARLVWDRDGEPRAFISLTELTGRGFRYAWAKHGPVWVGEQPSPMEEAQFRRELRAVVHRLSRRIAFIRLHAWANAEDLHELLQSVTFDRTVVLDLTQSEEDLMASFKKRGRRDVRRAMRNTTLECSEETARAGEVFGELYAILKETGQRDSFGISPQSTYERMLASLGEHARLYTVRAGGRPLCWGIVTKTDRLATYYYAGSNAEARKAGGPDLLVWYMATQLKKEGVESFDLMGIDSERAPQLAGVRGFKTKFSEHITEVAGAWDTPIYPLYYRGLTVALKAKRGGVAVAKRALTRLRGGERGDGPSGDRA